MRDGAALIVLDADLQEFVEADPHPSGNANGRKSALQRDRLRDLPVVSDSNHQPPPRSLSFLAIPTVTQTVAREELVLELVELLVLLVHCVQNAIVQVAAPAFVDLPCELPDEPRYECIDRFRKRTVLGTP